MKKKKKIMITLLFIAVLSMSTTVFAESGILRTATSGTGNLQAGGVKTRITSGTKTTARDCVRLQISSSSHTVSSSYKLYFRLREPESLDFASNLSTFTSVPDFADLYYYNNISSKWLLYGQTDSSSTSGTVIKYTVTP